MEYATTTRPKTGQFKCVGPNTYRVRVSIGRCPKTGKRLTASQTLYGTEEEARAELIEALERVRKGDQQPFGTRIEGSRVPVDLIAKLKMGATGAVSEMMVCIDLLRRGFDVYQSVAACGSCDLIALKYGSARACRIEVKTAQRRKRGTLCYGQRKYQDRNHDVLALVVLKEGKITYTPSIEQWVNDVV